MKLKDISLLLLRLAISYIWLAAGLSKLFNPKFISAFPQTLNSFASNSPFEFYRNFLHQNILSNASIFAQLTTWGEILTGLAFLLGFPMFIATIAGIFMNLNYFLVATQAPSQFVNIILIFSQFAAYANGAGSIWGFGKKIGKK